MKRARTNEEQAFIEGVEFTIDNGLGDELSTEDLSRYEELIANTINHELPTCCKECKRKEETKIDCSYFSKCLNWRIWFRQQWNEIQNTFNNKKC